MIGAGKHLSTMTPEERGQVLTDLVDLVPAWAYWSYSPATVTWTNPAGIWEIQCNWSRGTITTSMGINKWISTTWDKEWKRTWLAHHGALE